MMKPNEVRLGNWVWRIYAPYGHEQSREYNQIDLDDMKLLCSQGGSFTIVPIEITPELLEKAGFKKCNEFEIWNLRDKEKRLYLDLHHCLGYWDWCIDDVGNNEGSHSRFIKYVHQLQNLYFALMGTELNIQL
jgi:hypothetical protein